MKIYINATGNISPQNSYGHPDFLMAVYPVTGNKMVAQEPDYKQTIDPKLLRRMSRIIRMGVAAAMECLQEADIASPDAIITGTAYGCLQDTDTFMTRMVEQKEELLAPTAFIQSTHNTVGAQISLMIQCHNYNNTFVHRGFSFESALLDGMLLIEETPGTNALVGAVDEITENSHAILSRLGLYKRPDYSGTLIDSQTRGTVAGEGAAFFLLSDQPAERSYCCIDELKTIYKPGDLSDQIGEFINGRNIDLLIIGKNGDRQADQDYNHLLDGVFDKIPYITYKQLCGEYPTSTAFATWMGAKIIQSGYVPEAVVKSGVTKQSVKNVLIYNNYLNIHHSLILLSAC
jgi:3-oxoacyl-[acyl-carrier-protein] synthase II